MIKTEAQARLTINAEFSNSCLESELVPDMSKPEPECGNRELGEGT